MHQLRNLLLFIGLLAILLPSTVFAQAMPIFNDPLKIREVERYSERLDLTTPQKEALLLAHDAYIDSYARVRNGEIQKFEDLVTTFIEQFGFMQFQIPERDEIHQLIDKGKKAMKSIDRVDKTFFDSITGMFTEKQQRELIRIRNERSLAAYRILVLEMLSDMNKSARPNMTELVRFALDEESEETKTALEVYEQRMIRCAEESLEVIIKVIDQAFDMVDEMGLREMEREEMFMIFMDEAQMENLEARGNTLIDPLQKQAFEMSELNWKTWKSIDSQIAEEKKRPLAMAYFRKGFRKSTRGYTNIDNRFTKAIEMKQLNEGQKQELLSIQKDYETRSLSLATKYSKLLVQAWEHRTIEQQSGGLSNFDDSIAQAEEARQKIVESTKSRIDGILGSALVSLLDGEKQNEEKVEKSLIKVTNSDGAVHFHEESESSQTVSRSQVNLAGDVYIPAPMANTFANNIAMKLGLGEEGEDIISALFSDYREKYNAYYDALTEECEVFDKDTSIGIGARLKKKQELTDKAREAVAALDVALFDDLAVVTGFDRDDSMVQMLEQFRMRKRISGTGNRYGWGGTSGKVLDLVDVFVIDDASLVLSEKGEAILQSMILEYHQQADVLFKQFVQAEYDMNHLSDAMMLTNEMSKSQGNSMDIQQKWRDSFIAMQEAKQKIVRSNQGIVDKLLDEIPQDDYWTIRMHFVKVAYPEIFKDKGDVTTLLAAANAIPSLNAFQQGELSRMQEQYRDQYWNLCESMISINEAAALQENDGKMITKGAIKQQIDEEKLRFKRSELNDRMRMRLRMILNEDQIKHVPGLRPTVTASAEKN